MATLKENYTLPVPPISVCPDCGLTIKPAAYNDGGDWHLHGWDCVTLCQAWDDYGPDFEWPFVEDWATGGDLEAAGFVVVGG